MPKLSSSEAFIFIIQILVLLGSAKAAGELFKKIKQPAVIGEILAGIILGPTVFGALMPQSFDWLFQSAKGASLSLDGFILLSAIFLLFAVGLEIDIETIKKQGRAVGWMSSLGILIPLAIGAGTGWLIYPMVDLPVSREVFSLFMGAALSISALPVIARVLMDLGLLKSKIGSLIIAAATINDVVGWLIFTIALSMAGGESAHLNIWATIILTIILAVLSVTLLKKAVNFILGIISKNFSGNGAIFGTSIVLMLVFSLITEYIGIHAVFGAFLVGVAIAGSKYFNKEVKESIGNFTANILAPMFFVSVGLKVNFLKSFDWKIVLIVIAAAYISKILAGIIGGRLAKISQKEGLAVGLGIAARGGMGIILAILALNAHLVNEVLFEALVIMAVVTCVSAVLIKPLLTKSINKSSAGSESISPSIAVSAHHSNPSP
ncbi:cation:proton antiporter [Patescibacteria group bacterium]|nr:MAG: cation:proton antiporter [Patescibacteria group bacterium]